MEMLINLIMVIISQCICTVKHHVLHLFKKITWYNQEKKSHVPPTPLPHVVELLLGSSYSVSGYKVQRKQSLKN